MQTLRAIVVSNIVFILGLYTLYQYSKTVGFLLVGVAVILLLLFCTAFYILVRTWGGQVLQKNEFPPRSILLSGWLITGSMVGWAGFRWYSSFADITWEFAVLVLFGVALILVGMMALINNAAATKNTALARN